MRTSSALVLVMALAWASCASEDRGLEEPFRVRGAEFFEGALPGVADDSEAAPRLTALQTANLNIRQGEGDHAFLGQADPEASAVAITLDGPSASSGYWVVPTGAIDAVTNEVTWTARADFDIELRPGRYTVRAVAIHENGKPGNQVSQPVCVAGRVPDNGRACSDDKQPPRTVVSLQWDTNVDLDLLLEAEDGTIISPKRPVPEPGTLAEGAELDRDSNAGCLIDGIRTENVVWNEIMPVGRYRAYVNMFDACQQPTVHFVLNVYTAVPTGEETADVLARQLHRAGQLLQMSADPRAALGSYITDLNFTGN